MGFYFTECILANVGDVFSLCMVAYINLSTLVGLYRVFWLSATAIFPFLQLKHTSEFLHRIRLLVAPVVC